MKNLRAKFPVVSLGELSSEPGMFVDGPFGSNLKASEYVAYGVPVARIQNVRPNRFDFTDQKFITKDKAEELTRHEYRPGDLLIAKMGDPPGDACVVPPEAGSGVIVADVVRFRGSRSEVDHQYVAYFLNSAEGREEFARHTRGSTLQRVNLSSMKEICIPLPHPGEQRRIAAILDKADAIRRKREQALALANDFLKSTFLEMFGDPTSNSRGWPNIRLEELGDIQGGLQVSSKRESGALDLPYLRVANVYRDRLELGEIKKINLTEAEFRRVRLQAGDILIVEGHGNPDEIGRAAMWDGSIEPCVHQNHLIRFRSDRKRALPEYISRLLNSDGGRQQLIGAGRTTSGLNTISTRKVKEVRVPLPPIRLQQNFAEIVRRQVAISAKLSMQLELSNGLTSSLSQRAFRGEL
jgi:type I restriction enzyme S subunit